MARRLMSHAGPWLWELLPDVERLNIPQAGHPMFISDPDDFNRGVIEFIDRHDVDPQS